MNEIVLFAASMPIFVVDSVAGAIAGFLGGVTGFIAEKYFGLAKGWRFVPAFVFAVISVNLSHWVLEDATPLQIVSKLKQSRVGSLIFKYHPEAEREAFAQAKKNLSEPSGRGSDSWRALVAEIAGRYIRLHMLTASDAAIHHLLQTQADTIEAFKNNPTACVAKYLGTSTQSTDEGIARSLFSEELNAIADIIETSVTSPSAPEKSKHRRYCQGTSERISRQGL